MTVPFMAVRVHGVLHRPRPFRAVEVMERDDRVRYAPFPGAFGGGQGRVGPIVHEVEASDAQVVVVMGEVLGQVFRLVLDRYAESDVFGVVSRRQRGSCVSVVARLCILGR